MIALREFDVLTINDLPPGFSTGLLQLKTCEAASAPETKLNSLENAERDALIQELEQHGWNITTLARQLKMSRNTLYRKMRRLNIKDPDKAQLH